ncbi:class I SAM-dependent methyltransferase [Calidifontibacter terrae]
MLNLRKKRFLRRMAGYATNPAAVKWRTLRGQDQTYPVRGLPITLPPEHNLPFYQKRDPTYDDYAVDVLARLADSGRRVSVIDIGANVGDTALAVLASSPASRVVAVEGDEHFVTYLRRNLAPYGDRARVIVGFAGPIGQDVAYARSGSTGGFSAAGTEQTADADWIRPADLVAATDPADLLVWKCDIDGFDIHLMVANWTDLDPRCAVLWFEYDPARTTGDKADIGTLIDRLADSGRWLRVYDNLGRRVVDLPPGEPARVGLRSITAWLSEQIEGHVVVPYVDVWAFDAATAAVMRD